MFNNRDCLKSKGGGGVSRLLPSRANVQAHLIRRFPLKFYRTGYLFRTMMPVCLIQAASLPWHIATPKTTATSLYPTGQASMRSIQALQTFEKAGNTDCTFALPYR